MTQTNVDVLHGQVITILNDVMQLELGLEVEDIRRQQVEQWDSVNHLRLVLELEETFGITLNDEDVLSMQSLRQIEGILRRYGMSEQT